MNYTMDISLIHDTKEFYAIRDEWNELLEKSDQNTIFLRWEWLYNWWLVYGCNSDTLYICAVRDGGRLLGIAPLYVKKKKYPFPAKEINFLGSNIVCSDYLNFILLKGREDATLRAILSFLNKNDHWDAIRLSDIPLASKNVPLINEYFEDRKVEINRNYTVCPYLPLTSTWESIHESLLPNLRNTLEQKRRRLNARHRISFIEVDSSEHSGHYFSDFLKLNQLRFEKKGIDSPFRDKNFLSFHQNIIKELHEKGMSKLLFLKADGHFIAGMYLFHYNNKYLYYQSGFDPAWSSFSPGTLLFHFCIKTGHERGVEEFDFLQGAEEYKSSWTKSRRHNAEISVWNNTPGGILSRFVKKTAHLLKKFVLG